ncbi:alpha/beta fold hydrolase [Patulibacter defluvii]|uniref:alpha/beta fold hydrolase n=1 Tax=Patulibacter defluvii TaxID=3095358 RepID=UPI002A758969|nr:alpha/beta hydrolase family protein [Patulibacter sp. DM4]
MATYALIHGGGGSTWDWHLVAPELRAQGHHVVAVDLPSDRPDADLWDLADAVVAALGEAEDVIVVGHSLGGFTAPLVAERRPVRALVLLAAMIPAPGESVGDWWAATGHAEAAPESGGDEAFFHDVPPALAAEAGAHERQVAARAMEQPWPLTAWPAVPTHVLLAADDRFFPLAFQRRIVAERLGIEPTVVPGGHYAPISRPREFASALLRLAGDEAPAG